jgi:DTW domain-containing protein YfiP
MMSVSQEVFRAECYRCHKPALTCICARLPLVNNRTEVIVLQHPRERLHPIGTARFARLGLARSTVRVAWNAGACETQPPAWLTPDTGLLYPSPHAQELHTLPREAHPARLLVLDGTWHTAKTLYRDRKWLQQLPHYRLSPEQPGRYRLRREPRHDYVSTIEAIVEALGILEPETPGLRELISAFDAMIDLQIDLASERRGAKRTRKSRRPKAMRRIPHALVEGYERLVVVYGESARPAAGDAREFVYLVAEALASGARFSCLSRPSTGMPELAHMGHMGLTQEDFAEAVTPAELCARWQTFFAQCGDKPMVAAWNQRTLELLARATGQTLTRVALKGAYRAVHGVDAKSLEEAAQQRGLVLQANGFLGRAGRRLAGAVAVSQMLHAQAEAALPA